MSRTKVSRSHPSPAHNKGYDTTMILIHFPTFISKPLESQLEERLPGNNSLPRLLESKLPLLEELKNLTGSFKNLYSKFKTKSSDANPIYFLWKIQQQQTSSPFHRRHVILSLQHFNMRLGASGVANPI